MERCAERFEKSHCRAVSLRISCGHRCRVPFVSLRRTLNVRQLSEARASAAGPPGWAAIFVKAFGLVAKDEPVLRTLYAKWPWPHFYELPCSVAEVAIARVEDGEDCVLPQKVPAPESMPLTAIDASIRNAKDAPIEAIPAFRKIMQVTRLPLPLRRLIWLIGVNLGRQHANWFGSFTVTSVAAYWARRTSCGQSGSVYPQLWRGGTGPYRRCRDPLGSPGYRCGLHRQDVDPAGTGAEYRNRGRTAGPAASRPAGAGPGGRGLTAGYRKNQHLCRLSRKYRAFHLTEQRFLPRNRLLAGRFRPAMRFATRGPSLQA